MTIRKNCGRIEGEKVGGWERQKWRRSEEQKTRLRKRQKDRRWEGGKQLERKKIRS
jgi:hypothetical protein